MMKTSLRDNRSMIFKILENQSLNSFQSYRMIDIEFDYNLALLLLKLSCSQG